jgi:Carboxypeptidase regulatory-like domain
MGSGLNPSGWSLHLLYGTTSLTMRIGQLLCAFILSIVPIAAPGQQIDAPQPLRGSISGTVTDVDDAAIPGATLTVDGPSWSEHRTLKTDETGSFELKDLDPAVAYEITVSAKGFADWTSAAIVLTPGQALGMTEIKLKISVVETTVVALTVEQLATQQVKVEEKQRILGIVPNFFVVYDKDAVPLTTKLKYELAFRAATDVVSIAGDVVLAGVNQAADTPNYQQGAKGFGQRFGAAYADSFSNVMIGGAVLPSLLHQDPRYFYQGTGSGKSRAIHAMSYAIICKGDNGRSQFNYSGIGGNLIAGSLTNLYYPPSNRGPGLVFSSTLINAGGRLTNALVQEFILRKYTTNANK